MRILIDTNIIIPLEDSTQVLDESLSQLIRLTSEYNHQVLIHPLSAEDIGRDKVESRKKSILSRFEKYPYLEEPPLFSEKEVLDFNIEIRKDNDRIDNAMLSAVYMSAVHWLVTEDRGIHKKAQQMGIRNKVFYIQQVVDALKHLHPEKHEIRLPNLEISPLHRLDIEDVFFDSLREDYIGFNEWFDEKSREGRKAQIATNDTGELSAILIYKEEDGEIITSDQRGLGAKSLKLSTFKVSEKVRGQKIGELFLKSAFEYARKNNCKYVYLTVHPEKHEFLQDLCKDFGFNEFGKDIKSHRDLILVKQVGYGIFDLDISAFEFHRLYSPSFICDNVSKYIIPIKPQYHEVLFPDKQRQASLFSVNKAAGNTIKKAYLSHSNLSHMNSGDLVLFYRSHDLQSVTTLAIVEKFFISDDSDLIAGEVAKRTVYSFRDIDEMSVKPTKVILFRQVFHLNDGISLKWLLENGIVNGNIQSITRIEDQKFRRILMKGTNETCVDVH
ncbi:GNAT family N-acetyltransferase [Sulfurovum sp.]|uniref:GNAT family N-acetyltransferase n=1 Tax=Sulfurovum sp. TaxID=1969726 RepID=UPI00356AEC0E